jgi:type IV secretory pathway TraG/TraD family ATPase VirD4
MPKDGKLNLIRYSPPPSRLPIYQRIEPEGVSFFGRTNYEAALEEKKFVFGIKRTDRRRHVYIVGKSGVGKSKLLELLIRQDVAYGHGLCLIDPNGDISEATLDFIPEDRIRDVIIVDPTDTEFPVSFNPLANVPKEVRHQITQGLIEIVKKQCGKDWTQQMEHVMQSLAIALFEYEGATLRSMLMMLSDTTFRASVISTIGDEMTKRFWLYEADGYSEAINSLTNKLNLILSNPYVRNILSQTNNKIDFLDIMKSGKIIILKLSRGQVGEDIAGFLGSLFLLKLYEAGVMRAKNSENSLNDFYLYIDEFHSFVTPIFEKLFSESRRFGVSNTIAHQYISQIPRDSLNTILGNTGTIIIFRLGGDDATRLQPEMMPIFEAKDMINLGLREIYIKMTIDGNTYDPFSAETLTIHGANHESVRSAIIEHSRDKYAISLERVRDKVAA